MRILYYLLALFTFFPWWASAQLVVACNDVNILYLNYDNPVTIAVEGKSTKNLTVTTDNGFITGEDGHFIIKPNHVTDSALITIFEKTKAGKKEVGKQYLRVKCGGVAVSYLCGRTHGEISAAEARQAVGPTTNIESFEFYRGGKITGFTVIVKRANIEIFRKAIKSNKDRVRFSDDADVAGMMSRLQPGDQLKLIDITCIPYGTECEGNLQPMEFTLR